MSFRPYWCTAVLVLAFSACAQSETSVGPGSDASIGGTAGSALGGSAGATGGTAGTASGGTAGSGGTTSGGGSGGTAGTAGSDAGPDVQPDGIVTMPGLQGFWKFEETTGPVLDVAGNGLYGSVIGNVSRGIAGKVGNAISFAQGNGQVKISSSTKLDFSTGATIELWVDLASTTTGTILSRGTGTNDNFVRITTAQGNVNASFGRLGSTPGSAITAPNLLGNGWAHVAVVDDSASLRVYVNGNEAATGSGGNMGPISADLFFGKSLAADVAINGSLDEVMWFDTVRTDQEICTDAGGSYTAGEAGSTCN